MFGDGTCVLYHYELCCFTIEKLALRESAHKSSEVVGLFELSSANLDDVSQVFPHLIEEFTTNGPLTRE